MASASRNYARAFADVVVSRKLDAAAAVLQLRSLAQAVQGSPELRNVWQNPSVQHAQKLRLLDAIAARVGLDQASRNFVAIIIDHGRIGALPEIVTQVQAELNERTGIADAEVVTARELSAEERLQMEAEISRSTGKRVIATYKQDPKLIGGAVIKVGSTVYDGSVRGQLQRLKQQIAAG